VGVEGAPRLRRRPCALRCRSSAASERAPPRRLQSRVPAASARRPHPPRPPAARAPSPAARSRPPRWAWRCGGWCPCRRTWTPRWGAAGPRMHALAYLCESRRERGLAGTAQRVATAPRPRRAVPPRGRVTGAPHAGAPGTPRARIVRVPARPFLRRRGRCSASSWRRWRGWCSSPWRPARGCARVGRAPGGGGVPHADMAGGREAGRGGCERSGIGVGRVWGAPPTAGPSRAAPATSPPLPRRPARPPRARRR
jgi:hypothetical protein